jgi:hypothetical protein
MTEVVVVVVVVVVVAVAVGAVAAVEDRRVRSRILLGVVR